MFGLCNYLTAGRLLNQNKQPTVQRTISGFITALSTV